MHLTKEKSDICECVADALVFPASNSPKIYGTLDGQVYKKAGEKELLEARTSMGNMGRLENGEADITESFELKEKYKYLIHTSIPRYKSGHSYHKMKNCYINSLRCAEKKNLKSVVFPVLGAGASKFPYDWAIEIAERAIKQYSEQNPDSSIKEIILVEYIDKKQYDNILSVFKCLREFEKCNIPVEYIDTNSVMGEKAVIIGEKLKQEIKTETDRLYLKYLNEQNEYCEKIKGKESSQDICKRFNDELYYKLFQMPIDKKTQKAIKRRQLAKSIYAPDENVISNYKNPDYNFLKKKNNVIKLGLGFRLSLENFCRFLWCRGYRFPAEEMDFDLIQLIKKGEHKKALEKYSYKFISKRSADICYKEESKEEYEMDSY